MSRDTDVSEMLKRFFPDISPRASSYLVNFSPRWRFLYVETPKVACSTIKRTLQRLELGPEGTLPADIHDRQTSPLLSPVADSQTFLEAQQNPDWTRFGFVRNPFSRVVSCYLDKLSPKSDSYSTLLKNLGWSTDRRPTLVEFLEAVRGQRPDRMDLHWLPQATILKGLARPAIIGRFESFDSDFRAILERIAGPAAPRFEDARPLFPDHYVTRAEGQVARLVGDGERALILEIYGRDFREFGYSQDPAEVRRAPRSEV
jgi:hypothetical protein